MSMLIFKHYIYNILFLKEAGVTKPIGKPFLRGKIPKIQDELESFEKSLTKVGVSWLYKVDISLYSVLTALSSI